MWQAEQTSTDFAIHSQKDFKQHRNQVVNIMGNDARRQNYV